MVDCALSVGKRLARIELLKGVIYAERYNFILTFLENQTHPEVRHLRNKRFLCTNSLLSRFEGTYTGNQSHNKKTELSHGFGKCTIHYK